MFGHERFKGYQLSIEFLHRFVPKKQAEAETKNKTETKAETKIATDSNTKRKVI